MGRDERLSSSPDSGNGLLTQIVGVGRDEPVEASKGEA